MILTFDYFARVGELQPRRFTSGNIAFDDASAPYVRGSIDLPLTPEMLAQTDPRQSPAPRCEITVTQTVEGAGSRTFPVNLTVRGRTVSHSPDILTIDLASDEALLSDYAPLNSVYDMTEYKRLRDVVAFVLQRAVPGSAERLRSGVNPPAVGLDADPDALVWPAGVSALAFLAPLVQAAGLRLVCDERRFWTLRPDSYQLEGGESTVSIAVGENLIDGSDRVNRDDELWFDAALCRYRWRDENGTEHEAVDRHALRTPYSRVREFVKEARFPGAGFAKYAVERAQARGREVSATTVSRWHVRPELFGQIRLPNTALQMGNVRRVDFSFSTDEMSVTARTIDTPEDAYILAPPTLRYIDYPATLHYQDIDWSLI